MAHPGGPYEGNTVRMGYLRKVKTGRKKWFVLRRETADAQARLEYYDSEKKYQQGGTAPKKSVTLKTCFNINRVGDSKYKSVIHLYTKDECLTLAAEDEAESEAWFKDLLTLQQGETLPDGAVPKPIFAHIWHVNLVNRGKGNNIGILGHYRLCLTEESLTFVRCDDEDFEPMTIKLSNIRSCGCLGNFVYLEVGRSSMCGPGEIWMETEDHNIAHNVNTTLFNAMAKSNTNKEDLEPKSRLRSSSATESSKPIAKIFAKPHSSFFQGSGVPHAEGVSHQRTRSLPISTNVPEHHNHPPRAHKRSSKCISSQAPRERCDSMPSRARTTSEGTNPISMFLTRLRPSSQHQGFHVHSPVGSPTSPPSVGAASSTDSAAGSSYSLVDDTDDLDGAGPSHGVRYAGISLTPDEAIAEEDGGCDSPTPLATGGYMQMTAAGAPVASSDDGYVDMSPRGGGVTPAHSLSSVTSGTPSTDLRFAEYQLDKVVSFFSPAASIADEQPRPARAYSVGSRPDVYRQKRFPSEHAGEASRHRAASVGSKTKKTFARVLPPHGHPPPASSSSTTSGSKSTLLQFGRSASRGGSSNSIAGEMEDLMEMDFTHQPANAVTPTPSTIDGYLDMKPGGSKSRTASGSSQATTPSGYMEMRPGNSFAQYMDMKPSPHDDRTSEDYTFVDVSKQFGLQHNHKYNLPRTAIRTISGASAEGNHSNSDYLDMTHARGSAGNNNNRLTTNLNNRQRSTSDNDEGYVEMTVPSAHKGHRRQASLDNALSSSSPRAESLPQASKSSSDYTIVPAAPQAKSQKSLPIAIGVAGAKPSEENPYTMMGPFNKENKDSSTESSGASTVSTTPSSATMFPLSLNSPNSPVRGSPGRINVPASVLNTVYHRPGRSGSVRQLSDSSNDYVNFKPGSPIQSPDAESDYALMTPGGNKAAD